MPRIMYWNIERFGVNKFLENDWDNGGLGGYRFSFIVQTIVEQNPDIVVVVEVQTAANQGFGSIITDTSGGPAVQALLWELRGKTKNPNWAVVPPLIISNAVYNEGIAVFFDSNKLAFQGPMVWNGAAAVTPVIDIPGVPYDANAGFWTRALPPTDSGFQGRPQNTLAGKCAFYPANGGALIRFPGGNARSIWLTKFATINGRTLSLFSVHMPNGGPQRAGFAALAKVPEIVSPLQANEDRVVLGDFNVDMNQPAARDVFQHLTGGPAVVANYPVSALAYTQVFVSAGVNGLGTMLKDPRQSDTTGAANYYGYGRGANGIMAGLDNAFVARQGAVGVANNQAVVNRVVGIGGSVGMSLSIPQIFEQAPIADRTAWFQALPLYGKIGKTKGASDHLPLRFDLP